MNPCNEISSDWFWEGNVVKSVIEALKEKENCEIISFCDTASRQKGIDIHAKIKETEIIIEAKGYPSDKYQRGEKKGQYKKTRPRTQAKHWLAQVLLTAIGRKIKFPGSKVFIVLPNFPFYVEQVKTIKDTINKIGISFLIVEETGKIIGVEQINELK